MKQQKIMCRIKYYLTIEPARFACKGLKQMSFVISQVFLRKSAGQ
jgi:hypothetical protein